MVAVLLAIGLLMMWPQPSPDEPDAPAVEAQAQVGLSIAGVVVDGAGLGIPNAEVRLDANTTTTNASGAFLLAGLAPGPVSLTVVARGYVNAGLPNSPAWRGELVEGHPVKDARLVMHTPATLKGNVVAGRTAVAAHLTLLYRGETGEYSLEGSDTDATTGAFTLDELAPGQVRILVEAEGFALTESDEYLLADGEVRENIVIDLNPAGAVSGTISDPQGNPIANAEVVLEPEAGRTRRIQSQADGTFTFTSVAVGSANLVARSSGYVDGMAEGIVIVQNETSEADIVLERATGAYGRIFDVNGPVNPAFVSFDNNNRMEAAASDGSFKVLVAGAVEVSVVSPRHIPRTVSLLPGQSTDVELKLGGNVQGVVVDSSGQPVTSAQVSVNWFDVDGRAPYNSTIFPVQTVNASDGSFEVKALRPGKYTLAARGSGGAVGESAPFEIRASNTTRGVKIVLPSEASIEGTIRDPEGQPVPQARVELFEAFAKFSMPSTVTGPDGRFRIDGVATGRRSLRVSAKGFVTQIASGIDVNRGDNTRDVVLKRGAAGRNFTFGGIGAVLGQTSDGIIIRQTMDGKPAAASGLQAGDIVRTVDGQDIAQKRLDRVIEMLRGEEGASVRVEVERNGTRMMVDITRGTVEVNQ